MFTQETTERRPFGVIPYNVSSRVYLSAVEIIAQEIQKAGFRPLVYIQARDTVFQGAHAHFASEHWIQSFREGRVRPELLFDESFVFLHELKEIIRNRQANEYDNLVARFDSRFQAHLFGYAHFGAPDPIAGFTRSMWDFRREVRKGPTQTTLPYYSIDIRYRPTIGWFFRRRPSEHPKTARIIKLNAKDDPSPPPRYGVIVSGIAQALEEDGFVVSWREQENLSFPSDMDPMATVSYGSTLSYPRFGHYLVAK